MTKRNGFLNLSSDEISDHLDKVTKDMEPHEAAYVKLQSRIHEKEEEVRKNKPHVASLSFTIEMQTIDSDGTLSLPVVESELVKLGMGSKGRIQITGASFVETAKKLDKILRYINEQK